MTTETTGARDDTYRTAGSIRTNTILSGHWFLENALHSPRFDVLFTFDGGGYARSLHTGQIVRFVRTGRVADGDRVIVRWVGAEDIGDYAGTLRFNMSAGQRGYVSRALPRIWNAGPADPQGWGQMVRPAGA